MPSLSFVLLIVAAVAPPGMSDAGVRAAAEHRYCDASAIFVQLHGASHDPLALYRAAETAFAAGDYVTAIRLYRTLLDNHRGFDRAALVEKRIGELVERVSAEGPGTPCALPARICGDWIASAGEGCDDGNLVDGDGCDATCMPTGCGNGSLTADEQCDDGNLIDGDGCDSNCRPSACGNGAVAPGEQCDDGNGVDGDGCDANCTASACGNGMVASGEQCDDGNLEPGDGCDAACAREEPSKPLPWGLVGGGAAVSVAGALAAVAGLLPLQAHAAARDRVLAAEADADVDADGALTRALLAQEEQARAQAAWQTWGLPAVVSGVIVVVGGAVVAMGALVVWSSASPDGEDAATAARAPTPPTHRTSSPRSTSSTTSPRSTEDP